MYLPRMLHRMNTECLHKERSQVLWKMDFVTVFVCVCVCESAGRMNWKRRASLLVREKPFLLFNPSFCSGCGEEVSLASEGEEYLKRSQTHIQEDTDVQIK